MFNPGEDPGTDHLNFWLNGLKNQDTGNTPFQDLLAQSYFNQGPMPGSELDPRVPSGARSIGGMDELLFNSPSDYQKRFKEAMEGGDPTAGSYF